MGYSVPEQDVYESVGDASQFSQLSNCRFVYDPHDSRMHFGGNDIENSSHAEEYANAIGAPHHRNPTAVHRFDNCARGWVAGGCKGYRYGIVHFAPPIRTESDEQTFDTAVRALQHFIRTGAGPKTVLRGFTAGGGAWEQTIGDAFPELFKRKGARAVVEMNESPFIAALDAIASDKRVENFKNAGEMETAYHWTMQDGTEISGSPQDRSFHLDRLRIPPDKRRQGLAKKWLATVGEIADRTGTAITGFAVPDEGTHSEFQSKWIRTMRDAGFETDVDSVADLCGMTPEEVHSDSSYPTRDELIRHPRAKDLIESLFESVQYAVFKQVRDTKKSVYGGGAETLHWEQDGSKVFPTKLQAIRDFIVSLEPSLKVASDQYIRQHWPSFKRNHSVKVAAVQV